MTPTQAAALLTLASTVDNRKPDENAARMWAETLKDLTFEDCRDAIVAHYTDNRTWVMPADIRQRVKNVRWSRVEAVGHVDPPRQLCDDPIREMGWVRVLRQSISDGLTREQAIEAADTYAGVNAEPNELVPFDHNMAQAQIKAALHDPRSRPRDGEGA